MAEGKKTFIFYSDWINMIREMPDIDAGILLKHILSYVNDDDPQTDNLLVKMAFGHMKPLIKSDLKKWEDIRNKRAEYGKKGGKANAKQKLANAKQLEAVNDNVNVNVNVNGNVSGNKREKTPPKFEDLKSYFCERLQDEKKASVEAEKFNDHYTSNGWLVGRNKMKDWKAAVRNWTKNMNTYGNSKKESGNTDLQNALRSYRGQNT